MSTAEVYYREVKGLSVEENPILGREHHAVIELLEDYHRGMKQVKNNDLLHSVSESKFICSKENKGEDKCSNQCGWCEGM